MSESEADRGRESTPGPDGPEARGLSWVLKAAFALMAAAAIAVVLITSS